MVKLPPYPLSGFEVYETVNNPEYEVSEKSNDKFTALNGTIKEISYYDNLLDTDFDEDYEGISNTGSVSFTEINPKFYKGKKICLKKGLDTGKPIVWDDLTSMLLGFISEITYNGDNVNVKLVGMSKLLEQEKEFSFTKTKISKILKEIITSAGLKAKIDTTGLKDEKINYTNISSSGSSSGSGDADLDKWVQETIGSETDDLKKAELIHNGLCKVLHYTKYSCSRHSTVSDAWKSKKLNCADTSRVTVAAFKSAGLSNCQVVHGPNHFWTIVMINGKEYASDATSGRRKFNTVLNGLSYSKKNGDEPEC